MSRQPTVLPNDEAVRTQAVETTDRNIVVTAGAGTGKTTLLIRRMLHLLFHDRIPLREIVALTFTEKAANEMRVRLGEALREVVNGDMVSRAGIAITDGDQELARTALTDLVQAQIGTIHSFAAHLIRLYPVEARVDPGFVVDQGAAREDLFAGEWPAWLEAELTPTSPRATQWLDVLGRTTLTSLERLARLLADFDIPLDRLNGEPPAGDEIQILLAKADEADAWARRCADTTNSLRRQLEAVSHVLRAAARGERPAGRSETGPDGTAALVLKTVMTAKKGWASAEEFQAAHGLAVDLLPLAKDLLTVDPGLLQAVAGLIEPFAASFRQRFLAAGRVSFDGLLVLARDLLRDHPAVRQELQRSIRTMLIDEFQDTDPLQSEIILALAATSSGNLEPGKLFIVGDPKQCIYTFRRADIAAYEQVARVVAAGQPPLELETNFRAHDLLVDAVNTLFDDRIMVARAGLQPPYRPITAARRAEQSTDLVELVLVEPAAGAVEPAAGAVEQAAGAVGEPRVPLSAEEAREAEADAIVAWLAEHVGHRKRFRYRDVALLLRTLTQATPYLEALKRARIPYLIEGEKTFYGHAEVLDFLNLLRALDNPHDTVAVVGFLRSPFAGLTDRELYDLAKSGGLDYRQPVPNGLTRGAEIQRLYACLTRLHHEVGRRPVADLLSLVTRDLPLLEVLAGAGTGHAEQRLLNLVKLQQLAADQSRDGALTLKGFLTRIRKRIEQVEDEGESPLADETQDAVKVLTVHRAKGLEFPVVILASLHRKIGGREVENVWAKFDWRTGRVGLALPEACNLQGVLMRLREAVADQMEERRVLYVAMTRAKERLVLTGSRDYPADSPLGWLADAVRQLAGVEVASVADGRVGLGPVGDPSLRVPRLLTREAGTRTHGDAHAIASHDNTQPAAIHVRSRRAATSRRRRPRVSRPAQPAIPWDTFATVWSAREARAKEATEQPRFVSPTWLIEQEQAWREHAGSPDTRTARARAAQVGVICHRLLEGWDFAGRLIPGDLERLLIPIVSEQIRGTGPGSVAPHADAHGAAALTAEAEKTLRMFFTSAAYDELKQAEILGREVPLLMPHMGGTGQIMQGVIDVIYRPRATHRDMNQIVVADYKTDRITEAEMAGRAHHYAQQRAVYTQAVASAFGISPAFRFIFLRLGKTLDWPARRGPRPHHPA